MRQLFEKYIYAVLITLVITLGTFIYLNLGKLKAIMYLDTELQSDVFEDVQDMEELLDLSQMEDMTFEDIAYSNQMSNELATNTTDKYTQERIESDVEEDLKKYEEELFKEYAAKHGDEDWDTKMELLKQEQAEKEAAKEQNQNAPKEETAFKGKTTSQAYMKDRKVIQSYNPQYMCRGGATVVVNIKIDQSGKVISSEIDAQSLDKDDCFQQAARRGALRTRFNRDMNAEKAQTGRIVYTFIPQIR